MALSRHVANLFARALFCWRQARVAYEAKCACGFAARTMGVAFSRLWNSLFGQQELKICILGLDNAGKTTLMYKMTLGSVVATAPTIGSNTEMFEYKNLKFMLWDVGGQTSLRSSWAQYLTATNAVRPKADLVDLCRG